MCPFFPLKVCACVRWLSLVWMYVTCYAVSNSSHFWAHSFYSWKDLVGVGSKSLTLNKRREHTHLTTFGKEIPCTNWMTTLWTEPISCDLQLINCHWVDRLRKMSGELFSPHLTLVLLYICYFFFDVHILRHVLWFFSIHWYFLSKQFTLHWWTFDLLMVSTSVSWVVEWIKFVTSFFSGNEWHFMWEMFFCNKK